MGKWKLIPLKEKAHEVTVGFVGTMASQYTDDGIPFLRSQNVVPFSLNLKDVKYIPLEFHETLKKSSLEPGDVVIVRTGNPGASTVIPKSLPISNCADLVIIKPGKRLDAHFIALAG